MEVGKVVLDVASKVVDVAEKSEKFRPYADIARMGINVAGAVNDFKTEVGNTYEKAKLEANEHLSEKIGVEKTGTEKNDNIEKPNTEKVEATRLEKNELTSEQKEQIKNETHWSGEVVDHIRSMDEYEKVYKPADLHEQKVDGRTCLVKNIDMDYVSPKTGLSNREAMAKGASPLDAKTGEKLELHHMGQNYDAPLAELCENSEHGDGNDKILHDKNTESWRNDTQLKNQYQNVDRPNHWKERAEEV